MASKHPSFYPPDDLNASIWRYQSLRKFEWTMREKALWFARPGTFQDPFEGSFSLAPVPVTKADAQRNGADSVEEHIQRNLIPSWTRARLIALGNNYVSCWHLNEEESDGMWRLYGPTLGADNDSVCIESTYRRFWDATDENVFIGVVRYLDYNLHELDPTNLFNLLLHKRKCFAHERELRAMIMAAGELSENGKVVKVELEKLIVSVRLPPGCSTEHEEKVRKLVSQHCPSATVLKSSIDINPGVHPNFVRVPES